MMSVTMMMVAWGLTSPAAAMVVEEDVSVWGRVDRPQDDYIDGDVGLDRLRAHICGTSTYEDFVVGATVDPVAGFSATVTVEGDYCTFEWIFDADFVIDGVGFTVESTDTSVSTAVSASMGWIALSPWSVSSGTMPGSSGPYLITWID